MELIERFDGLFDDDIEQRLDAIRELAALLRKMVEQLSEAERRLIGVNREIEAAANVLESQANRPRAHLSLNDGDELVSLAELARELKISRTTLYHVRKDENFPQPVSLSRRRVAFRRSEVKQWLAEQQAVRHLQ